MKCVGCGKPPGEYEMVLTFEEDGVRVCFLCIRRAVEAWAQTQALASAQP